MKNIEIDRIEIRLKSSSPNVAHSLAAGLGNEISKQLTQQHSFLKGKGLVNISNIDAGVVQTSRSRDSSAMRRMIADRIVRSITAKTKSTIQRRG